MICRAVLGREGDEGVGGRSDSGRTQQAGVSALANQAARWSGLLRLALSMHAFIPFDFDLKYKQNECLNR
jgi:hypothetical protein